MSDMKYLVFENYIVEKIDEITEKLKSDIKEEKETNSEDRYSGDYPWECLLEELKQIGIEHRRTYIDMDYSTSVDDMETYSQQQFIETRYPEEKDIFKETPIEKHRREREEFRIELNQKRVLDGLDEIPNVIYSFGM